MLSEKRDGPLKMGGTYWYYVSTPNLDAYIILIRHSTRSMAIQSATTPYSLRQHCVLFYQVRTLTSWRYRGKVAAAATPLKILPHSHETLKIDI